MRAALYYAPADSDPLWQAGCGWLGRDPESGTSIVQPAIEGIADLTADPRRYGFHATLRPPMRFSGSLADIEAAAGALAARLEPFALPELVVSDVGGFLALTEAAPCPEGVMADDMRLILRVYAGQLASRSSSKSCNTPSS